MHTNMPFHPLKMFYSYTRRKHKRVLVGIIALSSLNSLSQYFLVTEGGMWLCKIKILKREREKDKCPRKKEE